MIIDKSLVESYFIQHWIGSSAADYVLPTQESFYIPHGRWNTG